VAHLAPVKYHALGNGLALLGKFTVDGNDLQAGAVHQYAIHKHAVSSPKLAAGAVHASALGKVVIVSQSVPFPHNGAGEGVAAACPIGSQLLGGGGTTGLCGVPLDGNHPLSDGRWQVDAQNTTPDADGTLTAYAVCLK
jgi:hypothetical protein